MINDNNIQNLSNYEKMKILEKIKCFILDMDGTIYLGNRLFDFTKKFLNQVKSSNKDFYFFTNNSSKNQEAYINKLDKMGITISKDKMLISNQVIIEYIKKNYPNKSVYVMGTPLLEKDFIDASIEIKGEDADLAIVGFDTTLTYEKLRIVCDMIRSGKKAFGVNPDFNCPVENGFIPDCGSIAALIKASTGVDLEFFGKPSKHTLDFVLTKTGYKEDEVAFVGDRLYTDIAVTKNTKATSILVLTGETQLDDLKHSDTQPTMICHSLEEIGNLLTEIDK